jgi:hypothetical protein
MKTWVKILLGLAIIGIIAVAVIYIFVYNKPHPDYENLKPDYSLTAKALFDEFTANSPAAQQKYNGKMVEITGEVTGMEATDSITIIIFAFSKGDFGDEGVRCTVLPKFNDAARKLQMGTPVKIKGYCTGFTGDVIFEQCTVEN